MKKKNIKESNPFSNPELEKISDETETKKEVSKEENAEKQEENAPVENNLAKDLAKLQEEKEQLNNQYIRLAADFDNYRKRYAQERESLLKYGGEEALKKLIEVLDNFDRAKKALGTIENVTQAVDIFNVLEKQLVDTFDKLNLKKIETENQVFDPNFHEAVMKTPTTEVPEDTIVEELQKGYQLYDKVLRPALVNVAVSE